MGRAARPLHDSGNHRAIERGSNLQAARRGGLIKPAKPAGERENTAALTPSLGARPRSVVSKPSVNRSWTDWRRGHGISGTALQQPGEARGGPFPGEGTLPAHPIERLPEVILGHRRGSGCALQQKRLAFDAQQVGNRPAFFGALRACVRLLES